MSRVDWDSVQKRMPPRPAPATREVVVDGVRHVPMTWAGMMQILEEYYPADVFTGVSGDPGPTIVFLTRRVAELAVRPCNCDGSTQ